MIEVLELVALVSLVAQAKDVDLCSSAVCGEEGTACACARIAVNVTSVEFVTSQSNVLSARERPSFLRRRARFSAALANRRTA